MAYCLNQGTEGILL